MTSAWSRRGFLTSSAALTTAGGGALLTPAARASAAEDDPYASLRATWSALLLGEGFSPTAEPFRSRLAALGTRAARWLDAMDPVDGSLWPDAVFADSGPGADADADPSGLSARMADSFTRLHTMAQAYRQQGTGLTGNSGLRDAVVTGLDHLDGQVYNDRRSRYGNWYSWQIGAPQALLDVCVLMADALTPDRIGRYCAAVDHFVPDSAVASYTGTSTGANRVDLCRVLALRGIVGASAAKLTLARDALSPVFPQVAEGDGLYADGSFVQHTTVPYTGSYGSVLLGGLGMLFALLKGTAWEVTDPKRQVVFDAVENAWAPFLYNGLVMDGVAGRAVSRGEQDDHRRGHSILASIVLLGGGASAAENARWRGLVKGWVQRDRYSPPMDDPTLAPSALARIASVVDDTALAALPEPVGHRLFPDMARATHRRPGWAASLSMAGRRTTYYESGNGENPRGWHTGSGMLYWWGDTFANGQYSDAFWPTVDPYRLPGTTVSRRPLADGEGGDWGVSLPEADWVGGVTDGKRATVGQHLKGLSSTLLARKSWFFLDDTVVCLGAGIRCRDGAAVETTVENRNLGQAKDAVLTVDGAATPAGRPWSATPADVSWAHLAGHGGYVFPGRASVGALREERTGRWRDINTGGSTADVSRTYLTLWFDHGRDPSDGSYAYQLLPGASERRTAARAADGGRLRVLANTDDRQGVSVPSLGLSAVNFWSAAVAGPLVADGPCSVMVTEHADRTATVCVGDPTRTRTALTVTWNRPVASVLARPATVVSAAAGAVLRLVFGDLSGTRGATQTVRVRLP
ncbi:polysaccharide lyase 8 family protein [Streptomyces sp. NPDC088729]|uniref:polysaccharide lyase 8 family protein n=1 Tax=Streptomyces sp. NPDC088729 TaxID=3365876 RepID=UPI0038131832